MNNVFGLRESAKILDCSISSIRALQNKGVVLPDSGKYTFDQLVLIRVILLIRENLAYRNFTFAKNFLEGDLRYDPNYLRMLESEYPVIVYLECGIVLFPNVSTTKTEEQKINNCIAQQTDKETLLDLEKEVLNEDQIGFLSFLNRCGISTGKTNKILVVSIKAVIKFLETSFYRLGWEDKFELSKQGFSFFLLLPQMNEDKKTIQAIKENELIKV